MTASALPRGWWGYHWSPPHPRSIVELIRAGTLDAELAGLLWLMLEGRVPVVVAAGPSLAGKSTVLAALLDFLPPGVSRVILRGSGERFEWLPEAEALGWRDPATPPPVAASVAVTANPKTTYLLASELSGHLPIYTWGNQARVAVRATARGFGLGTTIHAESLAEVIDQLERPPVGLEPDVVRSLGVVLIVRAFVPPGPTAQARPWAGSFDGGPVPLEATRRVVAAHYLRPAQRDVGGHVQRHLPAVLATWDQASDTFEHFAWGVVPDLASRAGRHPAEFSEEHVRRTAYLAQLAADGVEGLAEVQAAIDRYRTAARPRSGTAGGVRRS